MGPKKKRASPWPLILISGLLLLAPSTVTQKTRLTAMAGFIPFRSLATWAERLPDRVRTSAESQEAATTDEPNFSMTRPRK